MAYSYPIEEKKVEVTKEIETIINIFQESLNKNGIEVSIISPDAHEKKGVWNSFILKKIELVTETKFGATEKILCKINPQLDSFARRLMNEFGLFLTTLLQNENISEKKIVQDTIDNKYVLIKELLMRLMSHALAADIGIFSDGHNIINVATDFIEKLNSSLILFNKNIIGKLQSSHFGSHLSSNIYSYLDLMSNSIHTTDLIYKNKNATIGCLSAVQKLKIIAIRQVAVFLDSSHSEESYHNELLLTTFNKSLNTRKLEIIKILLDTKNISTEALALEIANCLDVAQIPQENKKKLINLFCFLINANGLEQMLERYSNMEPILAWFPIMSGMLNFNPIIDLVNKLFAKAEVTLKVDLQTITEKEGNILQMYSSHITPSNLKRHCLLATTNLSKLADEKALKQVMTILNYTAIKLDSIQQELGVEFFDIELFNSLLNKKKEPNSTKDGNQEAQPNDEPTSKSTEISKKSSQEKLPQTNSSINSDTKVNVSKAQFFSKEINLDSIYTLPPHEKVRCCIQINDGTLKHDNSYVLNRNSNKKWELNFYPNQNGEFKPIKIDQIPNLEDYLMQKNGAIAVKLILSYHIYQHSEKLFMKKKYLKLLNYLNDNFDIINSKEIDNTWLKKSTELRKKQSCYELFHESNDGCPTISFIQPEISAMGKIMQQTINNPSIQNISDDSTESNSENESCKIS